MSRIVVVKSSEQCLNIRQLLNPIFYSRAPVRHPCRKRQRNTRLRDLTRARQRRMKEERLWWLPTLPDLGEYLFVPKYRGLFREEM